MYKRQLIAFTNLTFLFNVYAYELVDAWCHFIAVFTGEHLNVHYLTEFSMWNTEGGITYFSFLVAENSAEESFFRCQFGFALRGNLTYQNVSRTYISTNADNTVFIKVLDSFFAYGRKFTGNFFIAQLSVPGITFVFFDVDGCVQVILEESFRNENGVFVVCLLYTSRCV